MQRYNFGILIDQTLQAWAEAKADKDIFAKQVALLFI